MAFEKSISMRTSRENLALLFSHPSIPLLSVFPAFLISLPSSHISLTSNPNKKYEVACPYLCHPGSILLHAGARLPSSKHRRKKLLQWDRHLHSGIWRYSRLHCSKRRHYPRATRGRQPRRLTNRSASWGDSHFAGLSKLQWNHLQWDQLQ